MRELGAQFQVANKDAEARELALYKRLATIWSEMRTGMNTLTAQVADIDNRTTTIQQYQKRRSGIEWAFALGVVLALTTAVITAFMSGTLRR